MLLLIIGLRTISQLKRVYFCVNCLDSLDKQIINVMFFRSAMVGYGRPGYDSLSTVVLIIIFVGFGAPMLLIVISIVYIIVKKIKAKKTTTSYGMIN